VLIERPGRQTNISLLQSILVMAERFGRQTTISLLQSILVMAGRVMVERLGVKPKDEDLCVGYKSWTEGWLVEPGHERWSY
jgi:putative AlgH/UPF0301 family transcriptional regulator